ncbi:hypothetical protein KUA25_17295 [Bacteroidales bacterium MSK.15.36]|uniref:V-type ATP synthase subunit E n=1 Tax=Anaerosalibacter bizertensis TaxID=932217 RepID=UPI0012B36AD0|nr:V-type ATP synthase subunit E family protein [Anaerosalibacter bizertensis]MBV1819827.1 hypothetical protein [Bacteroidales bacterium MSK.15.36]
MITIEDKLNIFYKIVLEKEKEESLKVLNEIEEKNKATLDKHRERLFKVKDDIIEKSIKNGELKKDELISQEIVEARKRIFTKKEGLLDDLILSLEKKAKDFVNSEEYSQYLLDGIGRVLKDIEDEAIIIYLKNEDRLGLSGSIAKVGIEIGKKISFENANEDIIGGFIVSDIDKKYLIDESFKGKIEENKYLIGEELYSTLGKAGDILD